ncbi:MAG: Gx transporter family protein, partial [Clostridia bacterium]|nr:Gx transporter family protein [Clostridia bacterium]
RVMTDRQIWLCSIFGAIAHNLGQMAVAIAVTRTPGLLAYLPALMISGTLAGTFTGWSAQFLIARMKKM